MKKKFVSTSKPELTVYYFVKTYFPNAKNRYRLKDGSGKTLEMDVFIPEIKVAIEYDGFAWHENKLEMDIYKTQSLNSMGITVVHIRDAGLKELPEFKGIQLWHGADKNEKGMHTNEYLSALLNYLGTFCVDEKLKNELHQYKMSYEEYKAYLPVLNSFYNSGDTNATSVTPWVTRYWDIEKNGQFKLQDVLKEPDQRAFIKCPRGESKYVQVLPLISSTKEKSEILAEICPFVNRLDECHPPCDYFYEELKKSIDRRLMEKIIIPKPKESDKRKAFYEPLVFITKSESLITYYLQRVLNDEIPYSQFEKLLTFHGNFLMGSRSKKLYISKPETFELLKEFQSRYASKDGVGRTILRPSYFDLSLCDTNEKSRKALFNYVRWVCDTTEGTSREDYVNRLFFDVASEEYSDEFKNMLKDLLAEYSVGILRDELINRLYDE